MGLTKVFQISLCVVWIHNDSMYVRFGGIRNTKTWSKSRCVVDRVSVPSPIAIDMLMDTMARDRAHMYLFSV